MKITVYGMRSREIIICLVFSCKKMKTSILVYGDSDTYATSSNIARCFTLTF